ncbi:hypothetical protein [Candidatus Entotheonella palauensis]|uniref:Uncharacterized protein n=1 Tax=Candidatus Entotheonella gemina TaxID=1429439 RepID=W4M9T6_9BACT|nr:hypothetical protein [Candidatus Entotheonella palauensis]ETX06377.1 MAG: hypothetical protein ETSY2_17490 [Candidatus Entotheonella gemina]
MDFEIIGDVTTIEIIARGRGVHTRRYLNRTYGRGNWRKMKGVALVRAPSGHLRHAEVHWYEAHGIGRKDFKIKRYVDLQP